MVEKVTGSIFTRYEKSARSQQGMAIWRDEAFLYYHGGSCDVMDLKEKKIVGHFLPESYTGEGSGDPYINHANQALFLSKPERGEQYPPIYITAGNDGGRDEEGYYGRCVVEQIHKENERYSSVLRQTIILSGNDTYGPKDLYEAPCWGWPSFLPDDEKKVLYIVSARYRTKLREYDSKNAYIITTFPMPEITKEKVILTKKDILDQFVTDYDIGETQAGMVYHGKIYYTFGFGRADFPNGMRIFDLKQRKITGRYDFGESVFRNEEIEACGVYNGELLCNTNKGGIYVVGAMNNGDCTIS